MTLLILELDLLLFLVEASDDYLIIDSLYNGIIIFGRLLPALKSRKGPFWHP